MMRIGVASVAVGLGGFGMATIGVAVGFILFGVLRLKPSPAANLAVPYVAFAGFGLLFAGFLVYLPLMLSVKCPRCGWRLLRNPKNTANRFVYHPSCKRIKGLINPWGYQMARAAWTKKCRCVRCGQDYDLAGPKTS
jgi:DNA-directed RNA polymerase subunit RPC12/RpoP